MRSKPSRASPPTPAWPDGKRFAFTVFDDTDQQTLENAKPVYDLLADLGLRTTKSVWPLAGKESVDRGGLTSADEEYRAWTLELQRQGFAIGLHNATYHTSPRHATRRALKTFREIYGRRPRTLANHDWNREGIYWGTQRLSEPLHRAAYNLMTRFSCAGVFEGELESSSLFWGDLCRDNLDYVRNFVFDDINTLRACPYLPYFDPERPYVRRWFASSDGAAVTEFCDTVSEANQDRLEEEGGACIMYTHFARGFVQDGRVEPKFARLMERLAGKDGWFVPVATLLDHIEVQRGQHVITRRERAELERRWLASRARARLRRRP